MVKVLIYNEYMHEIEENEKGKLIRKHYPHGIHNALKDNLLKYAPQDFSIDTVTLKTVHEITKEKLDNTDVLIWWGHKYHKDVPDEVAELVRDAVFSGMGAIFLHSAHHSKPFKLLMGTPCHLTWRENGDRELVWVCNPAHPIAQGIGRFIKIDNEETYGEPFSVPEAEETVFIGNFEGGEVMRAGLCYRRANGKIFYFQPGHETYPVYHNEDVIKAIANAINWAKPIYRKELDCPHVKKPLEE